MIHYAPRSKAGCQIIIIPQSSSFLCSRNNKQLLLQNPPNEDYSSQAGPGSQPRRRLPSTTQRHTSRGGGGGCYMDARRGHFRKGRGSLDLTHGRNSGQSTLTPLAKVSPAAGPATEPFVQPHLWLLCGGEPPKLGPQKGNRASAFPQKRSRMTGAPPPHLG